MTGAPNGRRSAWRLRVQMPDVTDPIAPAMFKWLREWVVPCCLAAPFRVTLVLEPPDEIPPDEPSSS